MMLMVCAHATPRAFSFALDSIAAMGKFPAFCIKTYRWGDQFFNGYDTLYVKGSGHKFNVKVLTNTWVDYYNFDLQDNMSMRLQSDPSTTCLLYTSPSPRD